MRPFIKSQKIKKLSPLWGRLVWSYWQFFCRLWSKFFRKKLEKFLPKEWKTFFDLFDVFCLFSTKSVPRFVRSVYYTTQTINTDLKNNYRTAFFVDYDLNILCFCATCYKDFKLKFDKIKKRSKDLFFFVKHLNMIYMLFSKNLISFRA